MFIKGNHGHVSVQKKILTYKGIYGILTPMNGIKTKICNMCGVEKSISDYNNCSAHPDGKMNKCRVCINKYRKEYTKRKAVNLPKMNGEKTCTKCGITKPIIDFPPNKMIRDGRSHFCRKCTSKQFNAARLKRKYGITVQDYNHMLELQGGVCAICGGTNFKTFAVDHNHVTGRVRGLLCDNCNRGLGILGDSIKSIQIVLQYLIKSEE